MKYPRYFVGLGSNIDYEAVLDEESALRLSASYDDQEDRGLGSAAGLYHTLKQYMASSSGGEVGVDTQKAIEELAGLLPVKQTAGGTGVRAGTVLCQLGQRVTAHMTSGGADIVGLLPDSMELVNLDEGQGNAGHLVLQYPQGATLGAGLSAVTASRSNRVIMVCDEDNAQMHLDPSLPDHVSSAHIVLISGLNAIRDLEILDVRIKTVKQALATRHPQSVVFFEDAAYHQAGFHARVSRELSPLVDIWSMNEDEVEALAGVALADVDSPTAVEIMRRVRSDLAVPVLVVHTANWAAAVGEDVEDLRRHLELGNATAGARFACGDDVNNTIYRTALCAPTSSQGDAFVAAVEQMDTHDVVVASSIKMPAVEHTTVGLGDAFVGGFLAGFSESSLSLVNAASGSTQ